MRGDVWAVPWWRRGAKPLVTSAVTGARTAGTLCCMLNKAFAKHLPRVCAGACCLLTVRGAGCHGHNTAARASEAKCVVLGGRTTGVLPVVQGGKAGSERQGWPGAVCRAREAAARALVDSRTRDALLRSCRRRWCGESLKRWRRKCPRSRVGIDAGYLPARCAHRARRTCSRLALVVACLW